MPIERQGGGNKKPVDQIKQTRKEDAKDIYKAKGESGKRTKTKLEKEADKYREAGPDFKGVGSHFYKAPDPIVVPKNTNNGDKPPAIKDPQVVTVISAPVQTGLVDTINIKEEYQREARRIILSLVKSAKDLLIKYNFSSIDRVAEYALDSDREARTEYVVSQKSRPEPPFTLSEAAMQDRFSQDVIQISNSISDTVGDSDKLRWFGIIQGSNFLPGKPRISNGVSSYDMRLKISAISDKEFLIKCYEIS